jgi:hypothetical protein
MLPVGTKVKLISDDAMSGSMASVMGYLENDYILVFNSSPDLEGYFPAMVLSSDCFEEVSVEEQEIIKRLSDVLDEIPDDLYTIDLLMTITKWAQAKIKTVCR